ncbi:hypothetical protein [Pedobacter alpinus]|uniref:Uncharacterized protein n=1 Tax=Pedobacter alpinus TaxID=1590643 RepID=A0ABW5TSE2_9SPHI
MIDYKVVFFYNSYLSYDLNSRMLNLNYGKLNLKKKIKLTDIEDAKVKRSFVVNNIYLVKGENLYLDSLMKMPPEICEIKIWDQQNLKSSIVISKDLESKNKNSLQMKDKVVFFKNDILNILQSKDEFKEFYNRLFEEMKKNNDIMI